MMISAALSILVPIILVIILGIRRRMNWKAMLTGAGLFIVFVLILERLMHTAVLGRSSIASVLLENKWIYMLYAGFAAGIFEETARLLGFRFLVRVSENESIDTGISYGLGHGGIESIIIVGLSNISNIAAAFMHNSGVLDSVRSTLSGAEQELLDQQIRALATTPPYEFLVSGFERMVALVLQVSMSLFVLKAVSQKKWHYFVFSILIHAGVDIIAVHYGLQVITDLFAVEIILAVIAILVAVVAFRSYRGREKMQSE
jgi:uncharacterized membrane protein YhfC